jgi:hypothetical protein
VRGLGCLVSLLLLVAAFWALSRLPSLEPEPFVQPQPRPAEPPEPEPPAPAPPDPDRYLERVGSLKRFNRTREGERYKVSYGFIDHHGVEHEVTCGISSRDHEREAAAYGYTDAEVSAAVDAGLRRYLEEELAARGLTEYVRLQISDGAVRAESKLPPVDDGREYSRMVAGLNGFYSLWEDALPKKRDALREEILKERGLWVHGNTIYPDYPQIAARATRPLGECFRALQRAGGGYNERQYLGLFVAFFQEIAYKIPPEVVGGRETLGLWVPTEVLINNHGDCDSKAVAFGALWRSFGLPTLVIVVPRHVLVGVPVRPGPGEKHILINNRYYLLAEVAGPGKRRPGSANDESLAHLSGHFLYRLIPAADG